MTGELDLSSAAIVAEQLKEAQASSHLVVADLRELEFIDCAGLELLVAADAQARRTKKSFVLVRGGGQVGHMLELTGLLESLELVDLHPQRTETSILEGTVTPRRDLPLMQAAA